MNVGDLSVGLYFHAEAGKMFPSFPWDRRNTNENAADEEEEDDIEDTTSMMRSAPATPFRGNWTGIQLANKGVDHVLEEGNASSSSTRLNKADLEAKLQRLFFAIRNAHSEAELAEEAMKLSRVLK